MQSIARSSSSRPEPGIRRSPRSFDAIPAEVQARKDICGNAKRLYGLLRSVHNLTIAPSYKDMAKALGAGVRSIVRWMAQLVKVGLVTVWRRGQGLTNVATVVGMPARSAIDARLRVPVERQATRMQPRQKNGAKKLSTGSGYIVPPDTSAAYLSPDYAAYIRR